MNVECKLNKFGYVECTLDCYLIVNWLYISSLSVNEVELINLKLSNWIQIESEVNEFK